MSKLYRSRRDAKLFGVCGGLAQSMNVDPTLVRIVVVVTTFFSAGTVIPLYLIASMVIPKEPLFNDPNISGGFHYHGSGGGFSGNGNPGNFNHSNFHTSKGGYSGPSGHSGYPGYSGPPPQYRPNDPYAENANSGRQTTSNLDDMMKDIEKKAMQKELEELRARLAKLENQKNDPRGDE